MKQEHRFFRRNQKEQSMTDKILWDPAFAVGNAEIDTQHKGLFALANALEGALDKNQLTLILQELQKYTILHFEAEEQLLVAIAYPHLDEHILQHNQLVLKLKRFSEDDFSDVSSAIALRDFVVDWLAEHIVKEDQRYANFIQNKDLAKSEPEAHGEHKLTPEV